MPSDHRRLVCEGPTVVGMMTSSMESGGSLDTAARTIADNGPPLSRKLFADAVSMVDTKISVNMGESLRSVMDSLPEQASGFRRIVGMCIAASESSDPSESSRILRDAADSALDSVRSMGESYSASLNFPVMVLFSLGIMVPMILMSLLPMLSIGGLFGSHTVDDRLVTAITVAVIPAGILAMCLSIRSRNPFRDDIAQPDWVRCALPLLISIPLVVLHGLMGLPPEGILLFAFAPAALVTVILSVGEYRTYKRTRGCVDAMMDSVMDMGNRMLSGENFESATVSSMKGKAACADMGEALWREMSLSRGDVSSAIARSVSPISPEMGNALGDILACSEGDTEDAGRLAVTLGRQYQNRCATMKALESRLKSMTDMMTATAAFFAPLVLGLSVAMLDPLSELAGGAGLQDASTVLGVYLVELCALMSVLSSCLGREVGHIETLWRFCIMCPIALSVFAICRMISL